MAVVDTNNAADEAAQDALTPPIESRDSRLATSLRSGMPTGEFWRWALAAALMPLAVYIVARPDWYYELNGLDSYFYTGYAQNFSDVLEMNGGIHYFVSRWTLYLPNHLLFRLFGAPEGFLVLRWLSASLVTGCIIALGRRRWRTADIVALCLFVLISPMFLRTVMTDYADSVTIPLGILAIAVVALHPTSTWSAVVAGLCGAGIAIGNPLAASVVICLIPAWLWVIGTWKRRLMLMSIALASGAFVLALGWGLFRFRYGIPNVYAPTIDFMRSNAGLQDGLKSPRLWWMGYRIWIYLPLIVIVAWRYLVKVKHVTFDFSETVVLTTCAFQYAFQIWYQFSRHGSTLEIPYYWSLMVPALLLGTVVVVGKLAQRCREWLLPAVVGMILLTVLLFRDRFPELYSSWLDAAVVVSILAVAWHRFGDRFPGLPACSVIALSFTFQIGAPRSEPLLPGESKVDVSYEATFDPAGSDGIDGYEAATWFADYMNQLEIGDERASYFLIGGGNAHPMAAMYNAHVTGRWLNAGWGENSPGPNFSRDGAWAVATGIVSVITMVGTVEDLEAMTSALTKIQPNFTVLLEGTAPDRFETRIMVVRIDPS